MSRTLAALLLALVVSVVVPGVGGTVLVERAAPQAAAAPQHAAAVVIDTGQEVRRVCVRFSEERITGEELLRRADVDAVFASSSIGVAVCALCGTGCPADDCFCESTTTGRYWNYSFADDGNWRRASRGASARTVGHGDVDGWAWGPEGATPPFVPFEAICDVAVAQPEPAAEPSPSPSPSPSASPAPQDPSPQPEAAPAPEPSPDTQPAAPSQPAPSPGAEPSTTEPTEAEADAAVAAVDPTPTPTPTPEPTATPTPTPAPTPEATPSMLEVVEGPSGGLGTQLALFGLLASGLAGAIVWRRRATEAVADH